LLKWGLPGGGIKSAKVAPTSYVYYPPVDTPSRGTVAAGEPAVGLPVQYALYGTITQKSRERGFTFKESRVSQDTVPCTEGPLCPHSVCPLSVHTRTSGGNRGLGNAAG